MSWASSIIGHGAQNEEDSLRIAEKLKPFLHGEFVFEPVRRSQPNAPCICHYRHNRSGMRFCLIAGGKYQMGLSPLEMTHATRLCSDFADCVDVDQMLPVGTVEVDPFLMSETVVSNSTASTELGIADNDIRIRSRHATLSFGDASQLSQRLGLSLPSEHQWEYVYRSHTQTLFPWGDDLPSVDELKACVLEESSWSGRNRFGVADMTWGQWCEDRFRVEGLLPHTASSERVVRGGAADAWPWQDDTEWVMLMSSYRTCDSGQDPSSRWGVRLVKTFP